MKESKNRNKMIKIVSLILFLTFCAYLLSGFGDSKTNLLAIIIIISIVALVTFIRFFIAFISALKKDLSDPSPTTFHPEYYDFWEN